MTNPSGANQILALLGELQHAVRDAVARSSQLEADARTRIDRERRALEAELKNLDAGLATQLAQVEAGTQVRRQDAAAQGARREARIHRGLRNSLSRRAGAIDEDEARRKYKVQYGLLHASRNRDAERAGAEQQYAEFQAALAQEQVALAALTRRARGAFRGYGRLLEQARGAAVASTPAGDEHQLIAQLRETLAKIESGLCRGRWNPVLLLFRLLPWPALTALLLLGHAAFGVAVYQFRNLPVPYERLGASALGALIVMGALYLIGRAQAKPAAAHVGGALRRAEVLYDACGQAAARSFQRNLEEIDSAFQAQDDELNSEWSVLLEEPGRKRATAHARVDEKGGRLLQRHQQRQSVRLAAVEQERVARLAGLQNDLAARKQQLSDESRTRAAQLAQETESRWALLDAELRARTAPVYGAIVAANATAERLFPPWQTGFDERWELPKEFSHLAQVGRLEVDVEKLAGVALPAGRLALPGPARFFVPLSLVFPHQGAILFETAKTGRDEAIGALNNLILRLLSTAPPGRLNFSIIDPVGLGQSFAGITHLSDFGENLINGRIWTQAAQIENRLAELNEHMEKVIQMYLRNEYATIAEYNEKAGTIAEKYHFLVVADFPVNFSETATKRLLSIAASGARCGVFTLIHWDRRQALPPEVVADDLRKSSVCLTIKGSEFVINDRPLDGTKLLLEAPPDAATVTGFIQKVGQASISANRIEVPFEQIAPAADEAWSLDTTSELRIPIGRTGATKLQYLAIGQGTRQHALIAGKTGSGKSTLFHVIITNLSLWCSPEQVEFYLVDFKKGVEFQCYAAHRLPHARVVAIESDREFGLSVLQRVDEELRRRGELFRGVGAQDLPGYKRAGGTETIPRTLLLIDEFQEFFVEDDRISQNAALLLDRIVRQGRAFGIHVVLGSQTLGGAYTLARTTIGQMVIRVALQCNEADAYLIMDENNPAPRLLSRPGEGIYNDMAGAIEGNSPFQTVWLSDEVRETYLEKIHELAQRQPTAARPPIVFEGNAPAEVRENALLRVALESRPQSAPRPPRVWLGAPNSIKGPTEAVFHRQSGNSLLIVGQRDEAALALLSVGLVALAAQYPPGAARFIVFDANPPGSPEKEHLERMCGLVPDGLTLARGADVDAALDGLANDLKARLESTDTGGQPETFLVIHGLQRFKKLRHEDDFGFSGDAGPNPGKQLNDLICEGPAHGIHLIAVCDTYNNVNRFLSRKALGEFEMRVLFQMSANDSAALIDSPRAGNLGLHRAVFYNEQEGYLEVFRPYALPDGAWIEEAGRLLGARRNG